MVPVKVQVHHLPRLLEGWLQPYPREPTFWHQAKCKFFVQNSHEIVLKIDFFSRVSLVGRTEALQPCTPYCPGELGFPDLECTHCGSLFHPKCVGVPEAAVNRIRSTFRCRVSQQLTKKCTPANVDSKSILLFADLHSTAATNASKTWTQART